MIKKRQLAVIIVGVLGFGATVTEAQYGYDSTRPADLAVPVASPVKYNGAGAGDTAAAPFLTNDTLSLPHPQTSVISCVGAGAGSDDMMFTASGFSGEKDAVIARSTFTGLRFDLNPRISLGLGYKNLAAEDPYYDSPPLWNFATTLEGVRTSSILFTVRLKF